MCVHVGEGGRGGPVLFWDNLGIGMDVSFVNILMSCLRKWETTPALDSKALTFMAERFEIRQF